MIGREQISASGGKNETVDRAARRGVLLCSTRF
jgi:hypothetical protein